MFICFHYICYLNWNEGRKAHSSFLYGMKGSSSFHFNYLVAYVFLSAKILLFPIPMFFFYVIRENGGVRQRIPTIFVSHIFQRMTTKALLLYCTATYAINTITPFAQPLYENLLLIQVINNLYPKKRTIHESG